LLTGDNMIGNDWDEKLSSVWNSDGFKKFMSVIKHEYETKTCYPEYKNIFNALRYTPYSNVKVVIIGQDPYHDYNQAHGLCFSVQEGVPAPPSLLNIYKELQRDLAKPIPNSGDLTHWAEQGVLLLNATLTVEAHKAGSHQGKGWEELTDAAIQALNNQRSNIVFMLWGSYAQRKGQFIDRKRHLVLTAVHPSPLSAYRGFIGCGHFSKANDYLLQHGLSPINW
jgi:uracil-DNA glycosylase